MMFPPELTQSSEGGGGPDDPPSGSVAAEYRRGLHLQLWLLPITVGYVIAALAFQQPLAFFPAYVLAVIVVFAYAGVTVRCPSCHASLLIRAGRSIEVCPQCGAS